MINLLEIDNINFSNAVNRRNYAVNHSDIYREWTDINQRKHREVIRRQYFNASGQPVNRLCHGVTLICETLSDGTIRSSKVRMK
jgi:hypothetical protein